MWSRAVIRLGFEQSMVFFVPISSFFIDEVQSRVFGPLSRCSEKRIRFDRRRQGCGSSGHELRYGRWDAERTRYIACNNWRAESCRGCALLEI